MAFLRNKLSLKQFHSIRKYTISYRYKVPIIPLPNPDSSRQHVFKACPLPIYPESDRPELPDPLDKIHGIRDEEETQQQHLESLEFQERLKYLIQLQRMLEETQPIPSTLHRPAYLQFCHKQNFRNLFPINSRMESANSCKYSHPGYFNEYKKIDDWTTYTPCHAKSDNGDKIADSFNATTDKGSNPVANQGPNAMPEGLGKQSAIYKLCKVVAEIRKNKY